MRHRSQDESQLEGDGGRERSRRNWGPTSGGAKHSAPVPLEGVPIARPSSLHQARGGAGIPASLPASAALAIGQHVRPRTYGEPTTFSQAEWHDDRGWWKLATNGEANDVRTHFGRCDDLALAAVSLRGDRHKLRGQANQDSFSISIVDSEGSRRHLIAVVADGMGSAKHSGYGARLAASTAAGLLSSLIAGHGPRWMIELHRRQATFLRLITDSVVRYRREEFEAPPVLPTELDVETMQCTLSFAVVPAAPVLEQPLSRRVAVGYVGDSPIFTLSAGRWVQLQDTRTGQVWDTATDGVLGATQLHLAAHDLRSDEAMLLSSDGFGNYLNVRGAPTDLGHDLAHAWARPIDWLQFISDVAFQIQGADDDRTAVMIWPGGSGPM